MKSFFLIYEISLSLSLSLSLPPSLCLHCPLELKTKRNHKYIVILLNSEKKKSGKECLNFHADRGGGGGGGGGRGGCAK